MKQIKFHADCQMLQLKSVLLRTYFYIPSWMSLFSGIASDRLATNQKLQEVFH